MDFLERIKTKRTESRKHTIEAMANDIFQITEYLGKLWFTYNGFLYCPCDMMNKQPLEALTELRNNYIARHAAYSSGDNE